MRFWDASAVVPLIALEQTSAALRALAQDDLDLLVWALTPLEVVSALGRRERARQLDAPARTQAESNLTALEAGWTVVDDVAQVVRRARRLVPLHPLRAADAAQLAAALVCCEERPERLSFVTLDARLSEAARREGFAVLPEPLTAR